MPRKAVPRIGGDPWRRVAWRGWYDTASWRRRRDYQLKLEPLCRLCQARGLAVAATIADHCTPHRGDYNKFRLGALQSLCHVCHNGPKREQELHGFAGGCDLAGNPVDPAHPWNQAASEPV